MQVQLIASPGTLYEATQFIQDDVNTHGPAQKEKYADLPSDFHRAPPLSYIVKPTPSGDQIVRDGDYIVTIAPGMYAVVAKHQWDTTYEVVA